MRKIFTIICLTIFTFVAQAQVDRNYVLVEIATGGWCYYCPGAAMGADDLHANGDPVAIIENHNGDPYANEYSNARNDYYSVSGFPTAYFDGSYDQVSGGSNTSSMYSSYKPIVDARILDQSPYAMEIYGEEDGDDYDITIRVQLVDEFSSDNLRLRFALTESDITYSWQGQTHLNFVNRIMAPDALGTDLSAYDLTEITDIELTFTFDNTWDAQNCELVAFIQDDGTQEVLQSNYVLLDNLMAAPPMVSAVFTSSEPGICSSGSVDYQPATSDPTFTYSWSFPGGTPSQSSDENPTVYYDAVGEYDVELVVSSGTFTASNLVPGFMPVVLPVSQPNSPDGDIEVCSGTTYYYSTPDDVYSAEYEWEIDPSTAGSITWEMNEATLVPSDTWTGDFTLKVRRSNVCGVSEWSDDLSASMYTSPDDFNLTGGGSYCQDSDGAEIGLDGSEAGIDYELYLDDVATGNVVAGTGSALSFGYQTDEGYYSIQGYTDHCMVPMTGQEEVWMMYPPLQPATPTGPDAVCNDMISEYATDGASEAEDYIWILSPVEAGSIASSGLTATVTWDADFNGLASVTVSASNECGSGDPSEEFEVSVQSTPSPEVTGEPLVCNDHSEVYMVAETEGSIYTWEVSGGTIAEGQGTYMVTVDWGMPGAGVVEVSEETSNGCVGMSTEFDVTIDDCTGIGENDLVGKILLSPNPASNFFEINAEENIQSVTIFSIRGEVVEDLRMNDSQIKVNTSQLNKGIYLVRITTQAGIISKRLIVE